MAQLAPFGFQAGQSRRSINEYYVSASDTSTLAVGDPVRTDGNVFVGRLPDSRVSHGMLHVTKAASGQAVRGVVVGIVAGPDANNLQSLPATKTRPYCVLVNDNPQALWDVQANNAAPLSAMAGMYASYAVGAPLGSVSSTVVDASSISATVSDLLIAEVLRNDGANSLLRVAFVQHEMAAAGGSPQIGAQIQSLVSEAGNPTDLLTGPVQRVTITAALSTTATQAAAATGTYYKARVAWNNNGASAPTVAVTLTGSPFSYTAPADGSLVVAGGTVSSITIARRGAGAVAAGVTAGVVPVLAADVVVITYSVAPTVTFIFATPAKLRIAVNADNDVHGLMIGQNVKRRDYEMTMGDGVMLVCGVPITRLTFSADGSITGGTHQLQVTFGN